MLKKNLAHDDALPQPLAGPDNPRAAISPPRGAVGGGEDRRRAQFERYLASTAHLPLAHAALPPERPSGPALARLIAHDVRVVQRFDDHAWVAGRLLACGAIDTLCRVVASNLLQGVARHCYRMAIEAWLNR